MPCECEASDRRAGTVGKCIGVIRVDSRCEQVKAPEKKKEDKEKERKKGPEGAPETEVALALVALAPLEVCQVIYKIINDATSTASVTEFSVGDEAFQFPAPIAPGGQEQVTMSKVKPAECKKERIGKVKLTCAGGGGMTLDKLEVCVLS